MTSGRDALHAIDAKIAAARQDINQSAGNNASDARQIADLETREAAVYADLARMRIHSLTSEGTSAPSDDRLAAADQHATDLIDTHEAHVQRLEEVLNAASAGLQELEIKRRTLEADHNAAVEEHEDAAAKTRERLEQDGAYQAKAAAVEDANATAMRAAKKLEVSLADRAEKGAPYEADPLFKYLYDRQYATPGYRASPPIAALDGWVASLIDYRQHRLNYARLLDIPHRLSGHVAHLESTAEAAEIALEDLERNALEADGVGFLRQRLATIQNEIDKIDADIFHAEQAHADAANTHAAAIGGQAGPLKEAHDLMAREIADMSMPDLRFLAAETPEPEDDQLVDELIRLKRERLELEETRKAAARSAGRMRQQLTELEKVRRKFKAARFDSPYSTFRGNGMIETLLSDYLRAALTKDELWRRLQRAHRTRQRDWETDFGGDEWRDVFGLPDRWGSTGSPQGRSGHADWSGGGKRRRIRHIPRAPRPRVPFSSGGGMSGGGRSGGGGFTTGGGF